jgi:hypothetical protein
VIGALPAGCTDVGTLTEAASWPVELALSAGFDPTFYGELIKLGRVVPWETGIPVAHSSST